MSFEYELTEKQRFFLLFYQILPNIELINRIWKINKLNTNKDVLNFYNTISPFQPHPCGDDCILKSIAGFIDPEIFDLYYEPRKNILSSILIVGHPWFLCKFKRKKEDLYKSNEYFTTIINEEQVKCLPLKKVKILEKAIQKLFDSDIELDIDMIIRYIYSIYSMYKETKILYAHPIGIDSNNELCRFE